MWVREVKAEGGSIGRDWHDDSTLKARGIARKIGTAQGQKLNATYRRTDLGFVPGCDCGADVIPCVVLDPFAGSGTTLQVARRLGRRSVGIELQPEYAALARRRSTADTPALERFASSGEAVP